MSKFANELKYVDLTEEDLFSVIGESLLGESLGSKEPTEDEKRQLGSRWFSSYLAASKERICGNQALRREVVEHADRNHIFGLIFDMVVGHAHGVPAGAVTSLILKLGVERICSEHG